jgi:hypothetical protein
LPKFLAPVYQWVTVADGGRSHLGPSDQNA